MGSMTDHAIGFVLGTCWQDLPPEVQHQTKRCFLDTLGALLSGAQTPVGRMMAQVAADQYGGSDATILVDGRKVSAAGAALANGFAANALDIDDGFRMVKGHPGACALPPILAAAEMRPRCSGEQFFTGLLVAYEEPIWEPPDSLPSDEALEKKFLWLASPVVGEENARALASLIWELDHCSSIIPILHRYTPNRRTADGGRQ